MHKKITKRKATKNEVHIFLRKNFLTLLFILLQKLRKCTRTLGKFMDDIFIVQRYASMENSEKCEKICMHVYT